MSLPKTRLEGPGIVVPECPCCGIPVKPLAVFEGLEKEALTILEYACEVCDSAGYTSNALTFLPLYADSFLEDYRAWLTE